MSQRKWHLIAYDVRDEARLRRVAKLLEGYGHRVQYSVFRCRLSSVELERLRWELTRVADPHDSLLVVPLCDRCTRGISGVHVDPTWPQAQPVCLIV